MDSGITHLQDSDTYEENITQVTRGVDGERNPFQAPPTLTARSNSRFSDLGLTLPDPPNPACMQGKNG
jgi:hypothetical protein